MQPSNGTRRQALQRRVATIVVAGLVVSFVLFGLLAREAIKESTQMVFDERLTMAQITANHIDFQLKEALDYLQSAPRAPGIDLQDSNQSPEKALLSEVQSHLPVFAQQVYIVDRNGAVLMSEPSPSPLQGRNVFDYVHIRRVLEGSKSEVSGVILDPVSRKPTVALAVPITDQTGRTVGVLGASADIARASLAILISGLKLGKTGHTQILDGNGTVMASTQPEYVLRRSHHYDLLFSLMRQKTATVVSHDTEDAPESSREVVAFAPLAYASWGVAVEQREDEALAVGRELETRLIILGLLSLSGALVTCMVVLRSVLVPIAHLTDATERIAAGNLEGSPLAAGADEIGRLAASFEVMRSHLKHSRDELDAWHKELESRVQQRTAELSCLFELSKTIASTSDLDGMLQASVSKVVEVLDSADAAYIYLRDAESGRPVLSAWQGELPEGLGSFHLAVASRALSARGPLDCAYPYGTLASGAVPAMAVDGEPEKPDRARDLGSVTCAPLLTQDRAYGALLLHSPSRRAVSQDLALVQALADQIAVAIQRAELAREAEQTTALREADRLKTQFISTITHELQTPLGFIKGYATTLLRPKVSFDRKTRREFLQIISEESDSLSALIDDLLDVSRIEAGALRIEKEIVYLDKLARRTIERLKAKSSTHQFLLKSPTNPTAVEADPRRVEQVLYNLLGNAVKYSPEGGCITVSVESRNGCVEVGVADQGIGIPAEEQARVFDRFFRATGAAAAGRGVGLGLSICKGIVEAHGGTIRVESRIGLGTTVTFALPARQMARAPHEREGG